MQILQQMPDKWVFESQRNTWVVRLYAWTRTIQHWPNKLELFSFSSCLFGREFYAECVSNLPSCLLSSLQITFQRVNVNVIWGAARRTWTAVLKPIDRRFCAIYVSKLLDETQGEVVKSEWINRTRAMIFKSPRIQIWITWSHNNIQAFHSVWNPFLLLLHKV